MRLNRFHSESLTRMRTGNPFAEICSSSADLTFYASAAASTPPTSSILSATYDDISMWIQCFLLTSCLPAARDILWTGQKILSARHRRQLSIRASRLNLSRVDSTQLVSQHVCVRLPSRSLQFRIHSRPEMLVLIGYILGQSVARS